MRKIFARSASCYPLLPGTGDAWMARLYRILYYVFDYISRVCWGDGLVRDHGSIRMASTKGIGKLRGIAVDVVVMLFFGQHMS